MTFESAEEKIYSASDTLTWPGATQRPARGTHITLNAFLYRAGLSDDVLGIEYAWNGLHLDLGRRPDAVLDDRAKEVARDSEDLPFSKKSLTSGSSLCTFCSISDHSADEHAICCGVHVVDEIRRMASGAHTHRRGSLEIVMVGSPAAGVALLRVVGGSGV